MSVFSKFAAFFRGGGKAKRAIILERALDPANRIKLPASAQGIPTVKFDKNRITNSVKVDLLRNIGKIREFDSSNYEQIYHVALQSISAGRNLAILFDGIIALNLPSMTKQRASEISLALNNKATALMAREKQQSLGIIYAVWRHSGGPCLPHSKKPSASNIRRAEAHVAADGRRYEIAKGMLINRRYSWPGRDEGCKCSSHSMIPGLDP